MLKNKPISQMKTVAKLMVLMLLLLLAIDTPVFGANDNLELLPEQNSEFQQGRDLLNNAWEALEKEDTVLAHRYFASAEQHFSNALATTGEDSMVLIILMHRATTYIGQGKHELALDDFDTALAMDLVFVPAYEGKALAYKMLDDLDKVQEMEEIIDAIYEALASQAENVEVLEPDNPPSPTGFYGTWYATYTMHNYRNFFTGETYPNQANFACGFVNPWKADVENIVYFQLPWNTWNRYTQGIKAVGTTYMWTNLSGYLQGYGGVLPFHQWTMPPGANYVLLIHEHEVCLGNWHSIPSYFRVSANYHPY